MTVRVDIAPDMIRRALERSGRTATQAPSGLRGVAEWLRGERRPTLRQLEQFAAWTHLPVGYFFLDDLPTIDLPLPDFRTLGNREVEEPSLELVDTIDECQRRQDWYREHLQASGAEPAPLVGSLRLGDDVAQTAGFVTRTLDFGVSTRNETRAAVFNRLRSRAEELGVLVMVSGIVGNNTHRRLNRDEFRGFSLADPWAPVAFVNNTDTRTGQIFTLLHELVHLWVGQTGVDQIQLDASDSEAVDGEVWCNKVASEVLVPRVDLVAAFRPDVDRVADEFRREYRVEERRVQQHLAGQKPSGGDHYAVSPKRASETFAREVIRSTLEGRTLYTEAFELLGISNESTFGKWAEKLGVG